MTAYMATSNITENVWMEFHEIVIVIRTWYQKQLVNPIFSDYDESI